MKNLNLSMGVRFALVLFACATLLTGCYDKYGSEQDQEQEQKPEQEPEQKPEQEPEYTLTANVSDVDGLGYIEYEVTITPQQEGNIEYTPGDRQTPSKFSAKLPKAGDYSIKVTPTGNYSGMFDEYNGSFSVSKTNPSAHLDIKLTPKSQEPEYTLTANVSDVDGFGDIEYEVTITPQQEGNIEYTPGDQQTPSKFSAKLPKAGDYSIKVTPIGRADGIFKEYNGSFTVSETNPSAHLDIILEPNLIII